jgi:hypothetical protein
LKEKPTGVIDSINKNSEISVKNDEIDIKKNKNNVAKTGNSKTNYYGTKFEFKFIHSNNIMEAYDDKFNFFIKNVSIFFYFTFNSKFYTNSFTKTYTKLSTDILLFSVPVPLIF